MPTFLELAQSVALKSGTVPGLNQPPAVTGLTGRLAKVVYWTAEAWRLIQNDRPLWLWMLREFTGPALTGNASLEASDLGITSRFGEWVYDTESNRPSGFSIYLTSAGATEEGYLSFLHYDEWMDNYSTGVAPTDKPQIFTVDPLNRIRLYPTPDADYTIRGRYKRDIQRLETDGAEVPEMPERFHDLIVYRALLLLAEHDESTVQLPSWTVNANRLAATLETSQLPRWKPSRSMA